MFAINESVEMARLTLIIGFAVALFFKKRFGFNPVGIVVPAFLVFMFDTSPYLALLCIINSFMVFYLYKFMFGKKAFSQRWVALINSLISTILMVGSGLLLQNLNLIPNLRPEDLFGFIIPGLIALSYRTSGIINTLEGVFFASLVTYSISSFLYLIFLIIPGIDIGEIDRLKAGREIYHIPYFYLQNILSVGIAIFAYMIARARVGGFVVLPIVSALVLDLPNFLLFIACTVIAYLFVVKFLSRITMIYGLTRFVVLAAVSMILVWGSEYYLLNNTDTSFSPYLGSANLVPLAVTVWANDAAVQGVKKSFSPFILATTFMVICNILIKTFLKM